MTAMLTSSKHPSNVCMSLIKAILYDVVDERRAYVKRQVKVTGMSFKGCMNEFSHSGTDLVEVNQLRFSYRERAFSHLHGCGFPLQPLSSDTHTAPILLGSPLSQSGMNHVKIEISHNSHTHACTHAHAHKHAHTHTCTRTHTHTTHLHYFIRSEYTSSLSIIPVLTDSALHLQTERGREREEHFRVIHPGTYIHQAYIIPFIMQYMSSISLRHNTAIASFPGSSPAWPHSQAPPQPGLIPRLLSPAWPHSQSPHTVQQKQGRSLCRRQQG